ncbi:MAG: MFS transporter [Erysipelotrichaceae bacterium]|nr:MFS transporter [Erysipelotrichaceae bacterium]
METKKLSPIQKWLQRIGYALGGLAGQFPKSLVDTFTSVFLVTAAGIQPAHIAVMLFITEIIDALTDYIMGVAIDKTKSRVGKNRFWMLVSIPVTVIGIVSLFSVPFKDNYALKLVWSTLAYILVTLGQTMVSVASNAIVPFLSFEPNERGILVALKLILSMAGTMAVTGVITAVVNITGGANAIASYTKAALIIGAIFTVITGFSVSTLHENDYEGNADDSGAKSNPIEDIKTIFRNKNYRIVCLMGFLCMFINIAMTNGAPYYAGYVLGDDRLTGSILMPIMGGCIIPMILMGFLTKRFKKKQIATVGALIGAVFTIAAMFVGRNGMLLSVCCGLSGIFFGAAYVTFFTMQPDVIDEVAYESGRVMSGLQSAVAGFCCNLGSAAAMSGVVALIGAAGFDSALASQPAAVETAIRVGAFVLPALAMLLIVLLVRSYDLDERYDEIRKVLGKQKTEE